MHDRDTIKLGDARLILLHHPGHTKGSSSFIFDVSDERRSYRILIANLPTIVTDKSFSDLPAYPEIAQDYAYTFASLKDQQFDIWVAAHASQFALHTKHKPGYPYRPEVFIDRKGYDAAIGDLETAFNKRIQGK